MGEMLKGHIFIKPWCDTAYGSKTTHILHFSTRDQLVSCLVTFTLDERSACYPLNMLCGLLNMQRFVVEMWLQPQVGLEIVQEFMLW